AYPDQQQSHYPPQQTQPDYSTGAPSAQPQLNSPSSTYSRVRSDLHADSSSLSSLSDKQRAQIEFRRALGEQVRAKEERKAAERMEKEDEDRRERDKFLQQLEQQRASQGRGRVGGFDANQESGPQAQPQQHQFGADPMSSNHPAAHHQQDGMMHHSPS